MHGICDREPSRIPKKRITRILKKSRKVRRLLRTYIRKSIPKSFRMHLLQIKLVKNYMHMESDVGMKEQRNIPLQQSNKNMILKMQSQYPHVIKSPKPKQSNA